jgi:N-hydroxyarylamine O-acetyltransferase
VVGAESFALDAYLERIGLSGRVGVAEIADVHRAHVVAIPFENLDPHRGVPVSLEPDALVRKLVHERRGGYCFEQNLLLARALEALGAGVELMLARVRLNRPPGAVSPRTHLVLRVTAGGRVWLADAGFGNGTLLEPIPFGPGEVHEQAGWRYRVVAEEPGHVLRTVRDGEWADLYTFLPEPVPLVDLETSNWFTATHPRSPFVTGLIVAAQRADGSRIELSDWHGRLTVVEETPASSRVTPIDRAEIPRRLESDFGLGGFAVSADGRVVRAGGPRADVSRPAP